jgi:hypothetical protein
VDILARQETTLAEWQALLTEVKAYQTAIPLSLVAPVPYWQAYIAWPVLKPVAYTALLIFGILEDLANSFYFGMALFALIPNVSDMTLFGLSLAYALLDSVFFYVYESILLQEALGIQSAPSQLRRLIDVYSEQLVTVTAMNHALASMALLTCDNTRYAELLASAKAATQALKEQSQALLSLHEPWWKKALSGVIFVLGTLTSAAGSYFLLTAFMAMLAPAMLGTPLGLALIIVTVLVGMAFHYVMGDNGMGRLINPDYAELGTLKTNWAQFNTEFADNLEELTALRAQFEKKPTCEMSTQTDFSFFASRTESTARIPYDWRDYHEALQA